MCLHSGLLCYSGDMSKIYNNAIKRREKIIIEYTKELERLTQTVEWYENQIIKYEQEIQTLNEIEYKETTK